ncbi:MAG: hypothetical protein AAGF11_38215 [Myxococcota bacterium]
MGRARELDELARLLPRTSNVTVVAVSGRPGVGKTFLTEHFARSNRASFPGGIYRVALRPDESRTAAELLGSMAARVQVDPSYVIGNLRHSRGLVILDDVDHEAQVRVLMEMVRKLARVPLIISGRHAGLGRATGWPRIRLGEHPGSAEALHQLAGAGIDIDHPEHGSALHELVEHLNRLPLALSLASGLLQPGAYTPPALLEALRPEGSPTRAALRSVFDLCWDTLRERLARDRPEREAEHLRRGLAYLAHGPTAPVGPSLAAAIGGLDHAQACELLTAAESLCLVQPEPNRTAWSLHPFIADRLRAAEPTVDTDALRQRMTAWFLQHLRIASSDGDERSPARTLLRTHSEALDQWRLTQTGQAAFVAAQVGFGFAMDGGPYEGWIGACDRADPDLLDEASKSMRLWYLGRLACQAGQYERAMEAAKDKVRIDRRRNHPKGVAFARGLIADVLTRRGEFDQALHIHQKDELPVYERLGDFRQKAITVGKIADILRARGRLDQALHLRNNDELPIYEQLGDVREHAITMGKIADILTKRGELAHALHVYQNEQLPVFEQIGDDRSRAVTMGRIADILVKRGEFDRALHIHQNVRLPVFEQLDDVRNKAVTMGKIADIVQLRGELDRALYIRQSDELPVYDRLGDVRSRAITMGKIADILEARGNLNRALYIRENEELLVYAKLGDARARAVTMGKIADILETRGDIDRALDIRKNDELPVYERLGEAHEMAVCLTNVAILRIQQYDATSRRDATQLLTRAHREFSRMGLPDAQTVAQIAEHYGLELEATG